MVLHHLDEYRDAGLLIIRLGIGLSFAFVHGLGKITGGPERWEQIGGAAANVGLDFLPVLWGFLAAFAEFGGGLLLVLGLLFRPAVVLLFGTMVVAAVSHAQGAIPGSPWHAAELAVLFLGLILVGPGQFSLDEYFTRRRRVGY